MHGSKKTVMGRRFLGFFAAAGMIGVSAAATPARAGFERITAHPADDRQCKFERRFNWTFNLGTNPHDTGLANWFHSLDETGNAPNSRNVEIIIQHTEHIADCDDEHDEGPEFRWTPGPFSRTNREQPLVGDADQKKHNNHWDAAGYTVKMKTLQSGTVSGYITLVGEHNPREQFMPSFKERTGIPLFELAGEGLSLEVIPGYRREDGTVYQRPDFAQSFEFSGDPAHWIGQEFPNDGDRHAATYEVITTPMPNPLLGPGPLGTTSTTLGYLGAVEGVRGVLDLGRATSMFLGLDELLAPSFVHPTQDLYVGIDLTQWVINSVQFDTGDMFDFTNGENEGLPGILVGTTPISLDAGGHWTTSDPYIGTLAVGGAIDGHVPEPATLALLVGGFFAVGLHRRAIKGGPRQERSWRCPSLSAVSWRTSLNWRAGLGCV